MTLATLTRRGLGAGLAALAMPRIAKAGGRVRIGYQKIGSLVILRQQRRLEALDVAVEYVEFGAGPPMMEAFNAGAIDFGYAGDAPPIFAQAAGADIVYVGGQPLSGAQEGILVQAGSPIRDLADLRGMRVAFTKGASAHYLIVKALAHAGLKLTDIRPVMLQPADAGAAFRSGALDAWAIWDPFFAIAGLEPTARVLSTGENIAPSNSFFLASRGFAERNAATVTTLLQAINDAAAWAKTHADDLAATLAQVTGVPLAAERIAAARGAYVALPVDDAIVERQQGVADLFAASRVIPARIDVRAAVWRAPRQQAGVQQ